MISIRTPPCGTGGDNTTSAGVVTESEGSGTVTGAHAYTAAGVYTITLTVTVDNSDDSAQSVFQYVVAFDPNAGFVTGGGVDRLAGGVRMRLIRR